MKDRARTMNDTSRVALNGDTALNDAEVFSYLPYRAQTDPAPMDTGILSILENKTLEVPVSDSIM